MATTSAARTVYAVIAMLAFTLLVMAAPPFGGDFGAAIAGAPAFGLFAWLLLGRRIRLRTVVILGAVLVVAGLLVGFADLLRPKDQQTHIGRFFDKVATGGLGDFFLTIRRKVDREHRLVQRHAPALGPARSSPCSSGTSGGCPAGGCDPLFRDGPVIRQTMLALVVVAVLGYALNDSGIAIPALMAVVFECALVYVALVPAREPVTDPPGRPPVAPDPPAPDEPRRPGTSAGLIACSRGEKRGFGDPGVVELPGQPDVRFLVAGRQLGPHRRRGSTPPSHGR